MKIKDPRYDYHITVSAHVLLFDGDKILMAKRPDNWEWAPGRWSPIGGKLYKDESFNTALKRKLQQELGFEPDLKGLYALKHIIMENKQAYMFFFVAEYEGQEITGEMVDYKWLTTDEILKMGIDMFAEYYYKEMLTKYLSGDKELFPLSKIESFDFTKIGNEKSYKEWNKNIIKKDFDPEEIDDFKSWKKSKSKN